MLETGVQSLVGKIPGEGNGYPLQYSSLENSMDCIVHGVTKRQTEQLPYSRKQIHSVPTTVTLQVEEAVSLLF